VNKKSRMKISELEKLSGMPRSSIHYYIREGILHPPAKTGRTMAYYDESHLKKLQKIREIKSNYEKLKIGSRVPRTVIERGATEGLSQTEVVEYGSKKESPASDSRQPRKQEIIDAAINLFSQKGYHYTNVRDITNALGISNGTFYLYYASKRDLFIEVVDDVIRNIIGDVAEAIKKERNLLKRTILRGNVFHENYSRYNEILAQLRAEVTSEDQWAQNKVKKIYMDLTKPLIREAQEAIKHGIIREVDPDLFAYILIGITEIMSLRMTLDDKYTPAKIWEFLLDLYINGLKPEKNAS